MPLSAVRTLPSLALASSFFAAVYSLSLDVCLNLLIEERFRGKIYLRFLFYFLFFIFLFRLLSVFYIFISA